MRGRACGGGATSRSPLRGRGCSPSSSLRANGEGGWVVRRVMCGCSVAFSFAGRRWVGDRRSAGRACLGGRSGRRWGHPVAGWRGIRDAAKGASPPAWSLGLPLRATPRRVAGHPRRRKGRLTAGVVAWAAAWDNPAPGGGASETPQRAPHRRVVAWAVAWDNPCAGWRGIRDAAKGASPPAWSVGVASACRRVDRVRPPLRSHRKDVAPPGRSPTSGLRRAALVRW